MCVAVAGERPQVTEIMASDVRGTGVLEYLSAANQLRAAYYRDKAAQFREIAEAEPIGRLRDRLLHLARQYDDVAKIVEARRQR